MKYQKGMKRYSKAGGSYKEDPKGAFYKGTDGKMYKGQFEAPGTGSGGDTSGQHDDHAHAHGDDNPDYPGSDEKGGKTKKSMSATVSEEDLTKTLDEIEDLYKAEDPVERKNQLLQKAQEGDLTADENEELLKALRGGDQMVDDDPSISDQLTKSFGENEGLQKALDVSEYLDEQHGELVKSLSTLGEIVEQDGRRQHSFNLVLAKAIHQIGTLQKGISERLGVIERQPVRPPKSQGVRVPQSQGALAKSFATADGGAPAAEGEQMSRNEILDTLCDMMEKSETAPCGESVMHATAKYEQTGQMSKSLIDDVIAFRRENAH